MKNAFARVSWVLFVWLLAGCEGIAVDSPQPVTITIAGSTAMRPVLQDLAAAFSRLHPDVLFDLRGGGSTLGEELARTGQVTLGASSLLPPTDKETGAPIADGLMRIPIGIDGIAIIVHPTNNIDGLSLVQLHDLYAGVVLDWMQLEGEEAEVLLVSREEGSGSRATFERRVMDRAPVSLAAVVMPTSADVVDYVAHNPNAIGYVSRAYIKDLLEVTPEEAGKPEVLVRPVEGMLPTHSTIEEQRYPLLQPLYLVSKGEPQGRARQFVDFVVSPAGQEIVARFHVAVR